MALAKTVLVTGANGLVGSVLSDGLRGLGHTVRTLSRSGGDFHWDPEKGKMDTVAVAGVDCVIHLAGEPVAQRWTEEVKERILQSRVAGTRMLGRAILELEADQRPAFVSASGVNYYGTERAERLDEDASSGDGFLAEVCRQWEGAAGELVGAGVRTAFLRTGVVLSARGGALAKMLPPFRAGVGGRVGSGKQRMSWIALPDLVAMYIRTMEEDWSGPINAVAPEPVTNRTFTKTLGRVLGRPTFFPVPKAAIRGMFGEMGGETVLSDLAVEPGKMKQFGFRWEFPDLEAALRVCLE